MRKPNTGISRPRVFITLLVLSGLVYLAGSIIGGRADLIARTLSKLAEPSIHSGFSIEADLTPHEGKELVTATRMGHQETKVEIFTGTAKANNLIATITTGPVTNLLGIRMMEQELPRDRPMWASLLLVETFYDQSVGAMSKSVVATAYAWNGSRMVEVWDRAVATEALWNTAWDDDRDSSSPAGWVRAADTTKIVFEAVKGRDSFARPSILARSTQQYGTYDEKSERFTVAKSRSVDKRYNWSDTWSAFILHEATVSSNTAQVHEYPGAQGVHIPSGTSVAVIESERDCVEALVFPEPYQVRVRLLDGSKRFMRETDIEPK